MALNVENEKALKTLPGETFKTRYLTYTVPQKIWRMQSKNHFKGN